VSARLSLWSLPVLCLALATPCRAADPAEPTPIAFTVEGLSSAALMEGPADARALVVLGHGAGLNMRSPLLASLSTELAKRDIATLRFNFPFAEAGRTKPDPMPVMTGTVRSAVRLGAERREGVPLLLAGQSLGGLIIVRAFESEPPAVSGVVMIGFPLHQAGRPSGRNAKGLSDIPVPLLFVQGSRDPLAEIRQMRALVEQLGPRARLRVVQGADHRFDPRPGRGQDAQALIDQVAGAIADFAAALPAGG
jgi:predicted alpha/beta-hydrolase family hydrolase